MPKSTRSGSFAGHHEPPALGKRNGRVWVAIGSLQVPKMARTLDGGRSIELPHSKVRLARPNEVRRSCRIQVPRLGRRIGERGHCKARLAKTDVRFPEWGYVTSEVQEATLDAIEFRPINAPDPPPGNSGKGKRGTAGSKTSGRKSFRRHAQIYYVGNHENAIRKIRYNKAAKKGKRDLNRESERGSQMGNRSWGDGCRVNSNRNTQGDVGR